MRAGTIAACCLNPHLKKGVKSLSYLDFFPDVKDLYQDKRKQSWEEQKEILMSMVKGK